ncbi:hypothetical protein BS17DRAFT_695950 [Gyrodon lividus]|nr:hypothetical protein BS17DRAFT_695950 [Gyrodon lividus]
MTDLLPPSPSSLIPSSRPSPSLLGSDPLGSRADANTSTVSLPITRSASPPRPDRWGKPGFAKKFSHAISLSLTSVPAGSALGPPIHPLDFVALMESQEATNSHLARTVDDLTRWLSVVEVGFTNMLQQPGGDAIAEEQEETPTEDGSFTAISDTESDTYVPPGRAMTIDVL